MMEIWTNINLTVTLCLVAWVIITRSLYPNLLQERKEKGYHENKFIFTGAWALISTFSWFIWLLCFIWS